MRRLPSLVALGAVTIVLAGCSTTSAGAPEPNTSSASATASATPSATRSATPSPSSSVTQPATVSPTPTVEVPPTPVPTSVPTRVDAAPETTAPAPAAPAVPTPTTEVPATPAPATEFAVTPGQEWGEVTISVPQGATLAINGSDYQPGQEITLGLGIYQSDGFVMDDQVINADTAGNYSTVITLPPELEPRTYGLLVYISDGELSGPEFEAAKRSVVIEVVAP